MAINRALLLAIALAGAALCGCESRMVMGRAEPSTGGDPKAGALAITRYGCGACHQIKGIAGARGLVGPPLDTVGKRMFIAGVLQNSPGNMVRWIQDPKAVDEKTAMPKLGVTPRDANDIAAYLYSLK